MKLVQANVTRVLHKAGFWMNDPCTYGGGGWIYPLGGAGNSVAWCPHFHQSEAACRAEQDEKITAMRSVLQEHWQVEDGPGSRELTLSEKGRGIDEDAE